MELSLLPYQQQHPPSLFLTPVLKEPISFSFVGKRTYNGNSSMVRCCCSSSDDQPIPSALLLPSGGRRALMGCFLAAAAGIYVCDKAAAVSTSRRAVHYVAKWKGVTFMTSRQGLGVGGGTPYGFDVGQSEKGSVLKGLDLGVEGMRVGGQRLLIVPPNLAYGSKGVQEIPPNATIELDVELLAIKQGPFGSAVKIVEG
ncbi:peptidyl-prolyl cis-trans isomerase FKBP16-4, chloroplastic-like isoform X4 [Macadamia integrifolia]|uniref:peptidyl-prolyl cis-trans isomerase FKBP16-4, chloroplastic-like isoform X4 n=1 Tax=Macadamia integrifolia TaxID=60698 RepID=UPI001C52FA63|nr:peptidyl-prolyl cis-trans isomerase FKBP16-4, chloroplastic-like isoform X4 [Macadamia integrifolia]